VSKTYHRLVPRGGPDLLSIVIPLYNEQETLPHLRSKLVEFLDTLPYPAEVVIVNDGSSDSSLDLLLSWASEDSRARVLNLARNFGHQCAASAGLDHASGDAVVLIDADLQDPLEVIFEMLAKYREGYDVVMGKRAQRYGESWFKRGTAWLFYRLMKLLIYHDLEEDVGDFRLISRACLNALNQMRETHRFLRGMVCWVGFPQTTVSYTRQPRLLGETKYPLRKMLLFAWTAAVSFSPAPLRLSFGLGVLTAMAGIAEGVYAVARTMLGLYTVPGWTSVIVVVCLIGGAILMSIGVLGEYVARIYEESKGRPLYIVAGSANMNENGHDHLHDNDSDSELRILNEVLRETSHDQKPPTRVYHPTATH
jgi:glycosyltransferase involved in cell wall biosynthesis